MPDELLRPTIGAGVDMSVRPWRPMSQTYVAFFGGVIASTVIAFLNARRLGVDADKRRLIVADRRLRTGRRGRCLRAPER